MFVLETFCCFVAVFSLTFSCYFCQNKEMPTFKDNDFTRDNVKLIIGQEKKSDLLEKIRKDIEVSLATSLCFLSVMMMMMMIIIIIINFLTLATNIAK